MNRLSENVQKHLELFCERYPTLVPIKEDILNTYTILEECYKNGGKLLIAGNGGSAADAAYCEAKRPSLRSKTAAFRF